MSGKLIQGTGKSKLHTDTLVLLRALYPNMVVQEERRVKTPAGNLPVDILLPSMHVAFECQGIQHFEFTPRFHRSPQDLVDQQTRDRLKANALRSAGWSVVVIRYDEKLTAKKLAKKILGAIKEQ